MVVPLVATSMIAGVLQLGSSASISSIGGKTLLYYSFSGLFAVIVGLVLVNWIEPGRVGWNRTTTDRIQWNWIESNSMWINSEEFIGTFLKADPKEDPKEHPKMDPKMI